jgi:hypothetical protein
VSLALRWGAPHPEAAKRNLMRHPEACAAP